MTEPDPEPDPNIRNYVWISMGSTFATCGLLNLIPVPLHSRVIPFVGIGLVLGTLGLIGLRRARR